ncbi:hypothetical protein E7811_15385 [Aliigemmobacter aestuarii]|uniref:DUF4956 domain-containing protein n=1 Tax=Aliigemmobacter aestuarii TaxID=1445661 RepID=A0A4S3MKH8_9RHOB|nr:hypothetical protein [Gemmobacter aestuarii]THD82424.1 hypothetical protein E7811_15385 [Gemmobacter aestuarii]
MLATQFPKATMIPAHPKPDFPMNRFAEAAKRTRLLLQISKTQSDALPVAMIMVIMTALPGTAAGIDGLTQIDGALQLREQGWQQLQNLPELLEFLVAVLFASALTASIAYHPVVRSERRTADDYQEPRTLFMFGLVGLLIGFMVLHHGYLIGFVIFGLGGLMRFKTDTGDIGDTRRLILVTLISLSVGLNLPVMAAIGTACAWAIIWVLGRQMHVTLQVQFESGKLQRLNMDVLRDLLRERGFQVISANKQKFKSNAEYLLVVEGGPGRNALLREMTSIVSSKLHGITDWHID